MYTYPEIVEYVFMEGVMPMLLIVLAIYFVYSGIRKVSKII